MTERENEQGVVYIDYWSAIDTLFDAGYHIMIQTCGKFACRNPNGLFAMDLPNLPDAYLICLQKHLN